MQFFTPTNTKKRVGLIFLQKMIAISMQVFPWLKWFLLETKKIVGCLQRSLNSACGCQCSLNQTKPPSMAWGLLLLSNTKCHCQQNQVHNDLSTRSTKSFCRSQKHKWPSDGQRLQMTWITVTDLIWEGINLLSVSLKFSGMMQFLFLAISLIAVAPISFCIQLEIPKTGQTNLEHGETLQKN